MFVDKDNFLKNSTWILGELYYFGSGGVSIVIMNYWQATKLLKLLSIFSIGGH